MSSKKLNGTAKKKARYHSNGLIALESGLKVLKGRKVGQDKLNPKEWLRLVESEIKLRTQILREVLLGSLIFIYIGVVAATFVLIFLQGFHLNGFSLPEPLLSKLGWITIGEVSGLIGLVITNYLRR